MVCRVCTTALTSSFHLQDALHLGGFTEIDPMGISENLWNFMLGPLAIKSVVDVGCGRGMTHATVRYILSSLLLHQATRLATS